jgi:hypothetical protein
MGHSGEWVLTSMGKSGRVPHCVAQTRGKMHSDNNRGRGRQRRPVRCKSYM